MKDIVLFIKENWVILIFFASTLVGLGMIIQDVDNMKNSFEKLLTRFIDHVVYHHTYDMGE